jgi:inner membrane protease ATP23
MMAHVALLPPKNGNGQDPIPLKCVPCPDSISGGFSPEGGHIILCQDRTFSRAHLEQTLAHELVHAWDDRRWHVDWNNLRHHACSEVCGAFFFPFFCVRL